MDSNQTLAQLNAEEQRVLGSLIEKSRTTPDYYPMSINGLQSACNQKTSRSPIVQYDEETIVETLNSLKKKSLISTATGGSSRVVKYKHNLGIVYPLVPAELALIGLLLLRGPQTPGELNTNSGRLYEFESIEEVQSTLQDLSKRGFVKALERRPGQKEVRYVHLLGDSVEDTSDYQSGINPASADQLSARVEILEKELSELKEAFNKLLSELT
ncbi:YceH family protein [Daejeonella sp.]|uniref:YceH family protein n=1 Tax=Daejeonella sp. TaxID=2805397 RepID=UPI002718D61B|nr:YceH family protein [Daejeonella sp.]MDO8993229.1 YceH family protein [Daejeonella sp.]MDP2413220.1 YceH family protein [Daejeonella sp.]